MKKNYARYALIALLATTGSATVLAGNVPGAVTITAADAFYHFDPNRDLQNSAYPNLLLAYNFTPHWAIELGGGILNSEQSEESGGSSVHGTLYSLNGIYRFTTCGHFEPYLLGGVGILTLIPNGIDSEHPGNINIGVGAQLFWGPTVALRAEARDVYQTTGYSHNDYMLNFGVSFLFGGQRDLK